MKQTWLLQLWPWRDETPMTTEMPAISETTHHSCRRNIFFLDRHHNHHRANHHHHPQSINQWKVFVKESINQSFHERCSWNYFTQKMQNVERLVETYADQSAPHPAWNVADPNHKNSVFMLCHVAFVRIESNSFKIFVPYRLFCNTLMCCHLKWLMMAYCRVHIWNVWVLALHRNQWHSEKCTISEWLNSVHIAVISYMIWQGTKHL